MARNPLEDKDGYPWTASSPIGWIVLIVALSAGTAVVLLALYLAVWMYSYKRPIPLAAFVVTLLGCTGSAVLSHWQWSAVAADVIGTASSMLFVAATFSLRHEIMQHYRERQGWTIKIGPLFTLFFSAVYINYCLNPIDLSSDHEDTLTSLNIAAEPTSAKIAK
jgi:hypothetical protein